MFVPICSCTCTLAIVTTSDCKNWCGESPLGIKYSKGKAVGSKLQCAFAHGYGRLQSSFGTCHCGPHSGRTRLPDPDPDPGLWHVWAYQIIASFCGSSSYIRQGHP